MKFHPFDPVTYQHIKGKLLDKFGFFEMKDEDKQEMSKYKLGRIFPIPETESEYYLEDYLNSRKFTLTIRSIIPERLSEQYVLFTYQEELDQSFVDAFGIKNSEWLSKDFDPDSNLSKVGIHRFVDILDKQYDTIMTLQFIVTHNKRIEIENQNTNENLSLYFDLEEFTKDEIVDIIANLSEIYSSIGGDELEIKGADLLEFESVLEPQSI
ncbi:hypothetical protein QQ008_02315 [Fulvivirgaceae bacterium BMA10]|uniref:Uncharacterized protein n=1 Tax=Splendidivirga corallicola TaxID=3051826 RepID=A0ABT8KHH1_9BACT|nr:hypothetical protein [Fulvivirgaceae bacterium BMA10]